MTKIKFLFVFAAIVFATSFAQLAAQVSTWDGTHTPWTHGTGTEGDPFLIENAQQLAYLTYRVNNGLDAAGGHVSNSDYHYKLMTDVDLNGSEDFQWTPIGYYTSSTDNQCFGGHFDGNGHCVLGVYINSSTLSHVGLFGYTNNATVKNLAVSGATITTTAGNTNISSYAGGIIGRSEGTIDIENCSCSFSGDISSASYGASSYAGGIVGYALTSTITNSYNTGIVNGSSYSGGIVGRTNTATISDCYNTGSINASRSNCGNGGIIGYASDNTVISKCYNVGNINNVGTGNGIGGIVGYTASTTVISNCFNMGNISGLSSSYNYCGGIVGYKTNGYDLHISNSYNIGIIGGSSSPNNRSGGIVGNKANNGTINVTNSYYLNTCGGDNTYGGSPMSADAMRSDEFVDILNNDQNVWVKDNYSINDGYPILQTDRLYVMTLEASDITQSHATLNGIAFSMNDNISITSQGFEYKLTSDADFQVVNTENYGNMYYTLTNLNPNSQYTYRTFCTTSENATQYGIYRTFSTLPVNLTTESASDIGQTSATLNGTFDVGDASGTWGFQYKAESDSQYQTIEVTETGNVSRPITGLTAYTVYSYRTFFTQTGTDSIFGSTQTFRTIPPWDGSYSPWTQGSGTEDDPYLIENAQHLAYLAYRVNNGLDGTSSSNNDLYYKVVADIDLYGSEDFQWTPIGISNHAFGGHFDGGNHTIYGLYVSGQANAGLFGYVGCAQAYKYATIKNTKVRGSHISGSRAGGIVGYTWDCKINNCINDCNITSSTFSGGIVGYVNGNDVSITNCSNTGNVSSSTRDYQYMCCSGGIAGYFSSTSTIANCCNKGNIYSELDNNTTVSAGGIVGICNSNTPINNCYNTGTVYSNNGSSIYAGGIVGYMNTNYFKVRNCYSTGCSSVGSQYTENRYSGAIVGYCAHYGQGYYMGDWQEQNGDGVWDYAQVYYSCLSTNCYYIESCAASNSYGGTSVYSATMQTVDFVNMLNDSTCVWQQDTEPFTNEGYPILTAQLYYAYTDRASQVADVSATLNGHFEVESATVTTKGFEYRKVGDTEYTTVTSSDNNSNSFSSHISGLDPNTTYEYRAFVNVAECEYTAYGNNMQFTVSWLNADTIPIYDTEMLQWVSDKCNSGTTFAGKYIKLMNNIVLPLNQPNNMSSIGSYPDHPFKGTFDGNGKLITNLYIDQPNTPYQGFFGYTLDANLYNVGLVNITASGRNYTGGMVAYAENTNMRDCYVNGGTLFALSYCGGLVGYQTPGTNSIISGCYNTCTVSGNHYVGGLLGYSDYGTVRNSYVAASVAAQGEAVGSIIGGANEVLMYNCFFSSEITGQENAIGENNFKSNEGMTNEQMRDPQFVETLNQGLTIPVWKGDYEQPINNGFPILKWQYSDIETCGAPENLTSIVNGTSITLIWTGEDNVDYYIVEYGLAGEQAQTETTTRNTISFNYEQPGSYYWRVKSVCPFGESNFVNGENVEIVGIEEIGGIQQIGIYPNPASESVTIQCEGQIDIEQINVFDVNGRMVMSESATGQIHRLDISNLQQGIYFVKVQTSDGYMTNKKLIVQ